MCVVLTGVSCQAAFRQYQHGLQCKDRAVHPEQRPGLPGPGVRADDGLRGRLPAPRRYGRVS